MNKLFTLPLYIVALLTVIGSWAFNVSPVVAQLTYCTTPTTCSPAITANPTASPTTYCQGTNPTITLNGGVTQPACTGGYSLQNFAFAMYSMVGATNANVNIDDRHFGPFNIGFSFNYNCNNYTQFFISSNGYITFDNVGGGTFSPWNTVPIANAAVPNNFLGPAWMDLDPINGTSSVTYMTQGTAPCRRLVVEFRNMGHYFQWNAGTTFQIVLYETTNHFEYRIQRVSNVVCDISNNRVCGFEYVGGAGGGFIVGRNSTVWAAANEGLRFIPNFTTYQYNWSNASNGFNSNNLNTSDASPPNASSTYVFTVYDPARGCTTRVNVPVTVHPRPTFTSITSNSPLCPGATLNLTINGCANCNTYSWTGPNGFTSTLQNPTRANIQPADAGTYNVTITSVNGCTATGNVAVTVNPAPTFTSITSNSPICQGNTLNLTINGCTNCNTYSWTGPNGFTSTLQNPTRANIQPTDAGTYTVTITSAAGCTATGNVAVTVNPRPTFTSITSNSPLCPGATLNLTINGCTNCNTYSWTGPNGFTSTLQNPTRTNVQVADGGTYNVTITSANGCTATGNVAVTVNPAPTFTSITSNSPLCEGATLNLTINGCTNCNTYSWTGPGGFTSTVQNPSRTNVLVTHAGTYNVTITSGAGCTATGSVAVTINPRPTFTSITSNSPLCVGQTLNLNINGCTNCNTYSWTGPNGFTSTLQNPTRTNVQLADAGTYNVTITSANGCTATGNVAVTVNATPTFTSITSNSPLCQGNTLNLTINGCTNCNTYSWTGPNGFTSTLQNPTRANVQPADAGTYNVTITAVGGCTATGSVAVTVNPRPTFTSITSNSPLCAGQTLNLTINGCTNCNTYSWTGPNGFTSTLQNPTRTNVQVADAGTYNVTITSGSGCTATGSVAVTVNAQPTFTSITSNSPLCQGQTLNLTINGCTNCNTYSWTGPNGFTSTLQNPSRANVQVADAGTYSVTITAVGGCTTTGNVTVTVNPNPTFTNITSNSPLCQGQTLNLTINGCTNCNTYSWTGPNGFTSTVQNPTRNNVQVADAGTYNVTITSGNGCTATGSVTVTVNPNPTFTSITSNSPLCVGQNLNLNINGCTNCNSYSWTGPNGFTSTVQNPTRNNVQLADGGTYNVTITSANGCTTTGNVSVTVLAAPTFTNITSNSPLCQGQTLNLTINSCNNCNTFSWTGPNGFTSTVQNPTRANMQPADAGTYSVTISAGSCTVTGSVSVTVNPSPTFTSITSNSPLCQGGNLALTINGCTNCNTYSWTGPNGFTSSVQNPTRNNVQVADGGTYTVTITSGNGCTTTGNVTVTVNPQPTFTSITSNSPLCQGQTLNLTINGCTNCNTYSWTGPNGFTSTVQNPTRANVQVADGGTYNVTITSGNGCTATGSVSVTVNPNPTFTSITSNSPLCVGQNLNLTINGCTNCNTYSWTGPNGFTSTVQNPTRNNVQVADAGTYNVTITSSNGCTATGNVTVVVNPNPSFTSITSNSPLCQGQTLNLTINGCTNCNTYSWTGPNGFTSTVQNPTRANVQVADAGTYTVTITSGNNCTTTGNVTVVVNPNPTFTVSSNSPLCPGQTLNLTINNCVNCNTYSWTGPNGFTSTVQNPTRANVQVADGGTYTVTVTSTNGCTTTGSVAVTVNPTPAFTVTSNSPVCVGQTLNLNLTGCTNCNTYNWTGPAGFTSNVQNPSRANVQLTHAGTYNVTVTSANGCTATGSVSVTVTSNPVINITANPSLTICQGQSTTLTASGANTYAWSNGGNTASITVSTAGIYTVTGTLAGCTGTASVTVVVNPLPVLNITANPGLTICQGRTTTLTVGGAVSYIWGTTETTPAITVNTAGVYSVTGTDVNGCTNTAQVTVVVNPLPTVTITPNPSLTICNGNTTVLTASGANTYVWSTGATTAAINVTLAGAYSVTGTDLNGCTNTATVTVAVNPLPVVTIAVAPSLTICQGQSTTLTASGATSYAWSNGGNTSAITVTTAGNYTVTGTDGNGCTGTARVTLVVNPLPNVTIASNPGLTVCQGVSTTLTAGGANTYRWSTNELTTAIIVSTSGTYTVTGTDLNGCTNTASVTVVVNPLPNPTANSNSPICQNGTLNLSVTPNFVTYNWSGPNGFTSTLQNPTRTNAQPLDAGTYSVTVRDANGCTNTSSVSVTIFALPTTPNPNGPATVCRTTTHNYQVTAQPGVTYDWTVSPAGPTISPQTPTRDRVQIAWNAPIGTYTLSVTGTMNNCTSAIGTFTVTITDVPVQPGLISGGTTFCPTGVGNYSITPVPNTLAYTWSVSPPGGGATLLNPNGNPNMDIRWNTAGTYTVTVIPTNACGNGLPQTLSVTVNPIPNAPTILTNTSPVCPGQNNTIYEVVNVPGTTYNWTVPNGVTINSGQGTSQINVRWANVTPGSYTISVVPTRLGCVGPGTNLSVTVLDPPPPQPGIVSGNLGVCSGDVENYAIIQVPTASSYNWFGLPPNATILTGQGSPNVVINWANVPAGSYTLSVTASNSCGTSQARTFTVVVTEIPLQPSPIIIPPYHCIGTPRTYSVPPVPSATFYTWTNSCTGWTGTSTTNTITYVADNNSPCTITVTASNQCGTSPAQTVQVQTIDVPPMPAPIAGALTVCQMTQETYTIPFVPNTNYNWTINPAGPIFVTGQGTNTLIIDWGMAPRGTYTLTATPSNVCGSGPSVSLSIDMITLPATPSPITGGTLTCVGQSNTYIMPPFPNTTYLWETIPAGPAITVSGNSATITWNVMGDFIVVARPTNQCGLGAQSAILVRVVGPPQVNAGPDQTICGPTAVLTGMPAGGNWSCDLCPNGVTIQNLGQLAVVNNMYPGTVNRFKYTVIVGSCAPADDFVEIVNDRARPGVISGGNRTICAGDQVTLQLTNYVGNIVRWESGPDGNAYLGIPNTTDVLTVNVTQTTLFRVVLRASGQCPVEYTAAVLVEVGGGIVASVSQPTVYACKSSATIFADEIPDDATGTWSFVSGPATPTLASNGVIAQIGNMNVAGSYIFRWTVQRGNCPPSSVDVTVVRTVPAIAQAGPNYVFCAEDRATFTGNFVQGATAEWRFVIGPVVPVMNPNGNILDVSGVTVPGDYVFSYLLTTPGCGTTTAEVYIRKESFNVTAQGGADRTVCVPMTTLVGNDPAPGTGVWEFVSGPSTPTMIANGRFLTVNDMTAGGNYVFRWKITYGTCPESIDEVTITRLLDDPNARVQNTEVTFCESTSTTLTAFLPQSGTGNWAFISGPVAASITTVGGLGNVSGMTASGTYVFRWTVTTPCGTSTTDVNVNRFVTMPPGYSPANAGANQSVCETAFALVSGSPIPPGFIGEWRFVSGPAPALINGFGQFGSITNMSLPGPYVFSYRVYQPGSPCNGTSSVVTITRVNSPTVAQATAPAQICGTQVVLTGNTPTVGTPMWSFVRGPITPIVSNAGTTATVSGMSLPGTYYFRYTISNPPCQPSAKDVAINVSSGTNAGIVTGGTEVCAGSNAGELTLSGFSGQIVRWEVSTNDFASFTIVNNVTNRFFYNNITQTTSFRAVVKSGSCPEETSNIVTVVVRRPSVADAGPDRQVCGNNVTLMGNVPVEGTATWSILSSPVSPTLTQTGNTLVVTNMNVAGTYVFNYTITNPPCAPSSDQVAVVVSPSSVGGTISMNRTFCKGQATGVLTLNNHIGNVVRWEASTDNFATFTPINNTTPTFAFQNLAQTTSFRAIVRFGTCAPETSSVATITIVDPVVANAGLDQTICADNVTLVGNDVPNVTKTWRLVSGPNQPSLNQNGNVLQATGLIAGRYVFSYRLENAPCEPSESQVQVNVNTVSLAGSVVRDMTICAGQNQSTLVLTGFSGTIVRWESSLDNWQTIEQHANPSAEHTVFNLTRSTQYRAVVQSGNCPPVTSNHATVTVVQPPTIADAGNDRTICGDNFTLDGNVPVFGTPEWRFLTGPMSPNMNVAGTRAIISNLTVPGTYVFQYSISNNPCPVSSDNVQIHVLATPSGGTLTANATVCAGQNTGVLQLNGNSAPVVRWESSTDNFQTVNVIPNTQNILTYSNLMQTTQFRAVVAVGQGSCAEAFSTVATVTVNTPSSSGGQITGTAEVCMGGNGTLALNGAQGQVVRWESSTGNGFNPIIVTSNTLQFVNLTQTTTFRAVVRNMPCPEIFSVPFTVQVVPNSVGGQLAGNATVCSGGNNGTINLTGHVGQVIRWESATDCQTFTPTNGNGNSFTYVGLTQTTCFRAVVQSGTCAPAFSSVAQITVQQAVAGTLSSEVTVCAGTNQGTLNLTGQVGTILGWESSTDNFQTVNPIQNNTPSLTYVNLPVNTRFRVLVSGGGQCPVLRSNAVEITVVPRPNGGILSANATVCAGTNNGTLVLNGFAGNILRWESSTDGFQTVQTIAHTNATLAYQNLMQTTAYRVIVGNNVCEAVASSIVTITTQEPGSAGNLVGGATVCGNASGTLALNGLNGTIVRWESSTDNFQTVNVINVVMPSLPYQNITQTTRYRVIVNTGACGVLTSNVAEVRVDQPAVAGFLSGGGTVCGGTNNGTLTLSGFSGTIVRWESSTNNFQTITQIPNTLPTLSYQNLTQTTQYRVVLAGQGVCQQAVSNVVTINVAPPINVQVSSVTGCSGLGDVRITATGGSGGFTYVLLPINLTSQFGQFNNIDPGTYTVRVTDASGCSVTRTVIVSNQLTPPNVSSIVNITTSSAVVNWDAVPPNGVVYTLRYRIAGDQNWTTITNIVQNNRFLGGLQNNTTYDVEVAYRCPDGRVSGFSNGTIRQFTTLGTGDCATPTVPIPGGVFVSNVTQTTAQANWNRVGGAPGYIVSWGPLAQNTNNWQQVIVCDPQNTFVMTNLTPNTLYGVRIRTNCSNCITALNTQDRRSDWAVIQNFNTPNTREGLTTASLMNSLTVYPNPTKGSFTIGLTADDVSDARIEITDVTGRTVYHTTERLSSGENSLPVELKNVSSGIYSLRISQGGQTQLLKLVIE